MRNDGGSSPDASFQSGTGRDLLIETLIEKYVRFPEELDESTQDRIRDAIDHDPICKVLLDFYESVYDELDRLPTQPSSQLEVFISSIFPIPQVVPLLPLDREDSAHARLSVLLPGMDARGEMVIRTPLVLLGSKESKVLVVFLQDIDRPESWQVQVYPTDQANRSNVLLTVPEITLDLFISDFSADFTIHGLDEELDKLESAILRLPAMHARRFSGMYTGDLPEIDKDALEMPSGHIVRFREQDDLLVIELDASRAARPTPIRRIALTADDRPPRILRVASGYGITSIECPADAYDIWFYE